MARKATNQVTTIGIDIGKNSFQRIGRDSRLGSSATYRVTAQANHHLMHIPNRKGV